MTVWASYGSTDSGDDLPIVLWFNKPTLEEVANWYQNWAPEEDHFYTEVVETYKGTDQQ